VKHEGPNKDFFKNYGTLDNNDSILSKSQFIFMRHAIEDIDLNQDKEMEESLNIVKYPHL